MKSSTLKRSSQKIVQKTHSAQVFGQFSESAKTPHSVHNYLYSFDLYIDSLRMQTQGYFYIVWKRGNKAAQTLKYNSESNKTTTIKQTLCLNLILQMRNGHILEKNTNLYLMDSEDRIIQQISITIHQWKEDFLNITIPISSKGVIQAKVRAKMLMEINEKVVGEDIENLSSIEEWELESALQKVRYKIMKTDYKFLDDEKDELLKLRKELQDILYYNNKLKNDRSLLISKNLSLEGELSSLKQQYRQSMSQLKKYYENRLEIRQIVYQDEIAKLVSHYNANSQINISILQNLLHEYKNEEQKFKQQKIKSVKIDYELKCMIQKLEKTQNQSQQLKIIIQQLQKGKQDLLVQHAKLQKCNKDYQIQIEKDLANRDSLNKKILQLSLENQTLKNANEKIIQDLNSNIQLTERLQAQSANYSEMIEKLSEQLESNKYQLDFTEQAYKKQKEENQMKQELYRAHIRKLEAEIFELENRQAALGKQKQSQNVIIKEINNVKDTNLDQSRRSLNNIGQQGLNNKSKKSNDIDNELNSQTKDEFIKTIQQLKGQILRLNAQNDKLEDEIKFMNQNAINVQQYEALKEQIKKLQIKVLQEENNLSLAQQSLQKAQNDSQKKVQEAHAQNQIAQLIEKINVLEVDRDRLTKQKQDIQKRYDYLTVQMAQKYAEAQKQRQMAERKIKRIQVEQYCDSQIEENKQLAKKMKEEYEKMVNKLSQQAFESSSREKIESSSQSKKKTQKSRQIKNKATESEGVISEKNSEQQNKKRKINKSCSLNIPFEQQSSPDRQKIIQEQSAQSHIISHESSDKNKKEKNQSKQQIKSPFSFIIPNKQHPQQKELQKNEAIKQPVGIEKQHSQKSIDLSERSKSKDLSEKSKSRQSYVSQGTMYMFKKVSHREKIDKLTLDIGNLQKINQKLEQEKISLQKQLNNNQIEIAILSEQLKKGEEEVNLLKESLVIETSKKRGAQKINKHTQTEIQKQSKHVQAQIPDPEVIKIKNQLQLLNEEMNQTRKSCTHQLEELQGDKKFLICKIEDLSKKNDYLVQKYQNKNGEFEKLKIQFEQKNAQFKNIIQQIKLEKAQTDFNLNNQLNLNKKLKSQIEDLEERAKKNDVMNQLKHCQYELEVISKKNLELNQTIYQQKLEKETIEDENKIVKKKYADLQKKISEVQDEKQKLEKLIDDFRRKQNRSKRQMQDHQDSAQKNRLKLKKLNQQLNLSKNHQTQQQFEIKKLQDQLNSINTNYELKEYELSNLKKQLEKMRKTIMEKEEEKISRKSQLRRQINNLQQTLASRDKQIINLQSMIKQLTYKLDQNIAENQKIINEKTSSFSEKLKMYINELNDMKKIHNENQYEMATLKNQLGETIQSYETLRNSYYKLEQQYREGLNNQQQLESLLNSSKKQSEKNKQQISEYLRQLQGTKNQINIIKQNLEKQQKQNKKNKQIIDELNKKNQQYLESLNKYKIKLTDYETATIIQNKTNQKLEDIEKQRQALRKNLRQLKQIHEEHCACYQYTFQQLNKAVSEESQKWREKLETSIQILNKEYQNKGNDDKKRFQSQVVDLMNQVSRFKVQSQKKSDIISEMELKLSKLEILPKKIQQIQQIYKTKEKQCSRLPILQSQNQKLTNRVSQLEAIFQKTKQQKEEQYQKTKQYKKRKQELEIYIDEFQSLARSLECENKDFKKRIIQLEQNQTSLKTEIEELLSKIYKTEKQKESISIKTEQSRNQYLKTIHNLENKLQLLNNTSDQHAKMLHESYKNNMEELKEQVDHLNEQLFLKNQEFKQLQIANDRILLSNEDNQREIEILRAKSRENEQLFELQLTKCKNKLNDHEKMYKINIANLQSQLEKNAKQITNLRMKSQSQKQFKNSASNESLNSISLVNTKRYEEKIKAKDEKIDELKNNVYILEETIVRLKRNSTQSQQYIDTITNLKKQIKENMIQLKNNQLQFEKSQKKNQQAVNQLKEQLFSARKNYEMTKLQLQEKILENQSIKLELKTVKQLYQQLKDELQKRKNAFQKNSQEDNHYSQLFNQKNSYIAELQLKIQDYRQQLQEKENQIDKKCHIISVFEKKTIELENTQVKLKNTLQSKLNQQGQHYKYQINRLTEDNETILKENKKMKQQMQRVQKQNWNISTQLSLNQSSIDNLSINLDEATNRYKQAQFQLKKYHILEQKCLRAFNISLDEAFYQNYLLDQLQQKQYQINMLEEEVDQLKFLNQRKLMDYDELKKQNYALQIQSEDAQFASEQIQQLRQICDKLEQEKKQCVFRLDFFMMQFETIIQASHGQLRERLQDVINRSKTAF